MCDDHFARIGDESFVYSGPDRVIKVWFMAIVSRHSCIDSEFSGWTNDVWGWGAVESKSSCVLGSSFCSFLPVPLGVLVELRDCYALSGYLMLDSLEAPGELELEI